MLMYLIVFFIFGLFFGSFYTVIGLRVPKGEGFVNGRSHCDVCGHSLSFLDMIPLFSYLFLMGKCRYCKTKFSNVSTLMELFTGILFALSYYVFGFTYELLIALGVVSMLIIISVSDITYYIIPDSLLIFFSGYFLIIIAISNGIMAALHSVFYGLILFSIMYLIMIIGEAIFKKECLGGGDVKMMFVIGLVITPIMGIFSIFLASFLALPISLLILYMKRQKMIPFGPFLLLSFAIIYFMQINIHTVINMIRFI